MTTARTDRETHREHDREQAADWQRIELEAREQATASETTPMERGALVAWAECRFGRTDGFGVVHRVGVWSIDDARTVCGDRIPAAILRVALTPNLARTLGRCRYCEAEYIEKGAAA